MAQVTLISLYGDKPSDFADAIARNQEIVIQSAGAAFTPYELSQVHATIMGMERRPASPMLNANFAKHRGRDVTMDFEGYLTYLRGCGLFPLRIQIGGFANRDYAFASRATSPYERSFSIQGDKVVMMGWPIRGTPSTTRPSTPATWAQEAWTYPPTLDTIRAAAQQFGILHSYHRSPTDVDNDLFFRIGLLDPNALSPAKTRSLEHSMREQLASQPPITVEIGLDRVSVAVYEDDRLPPASTRTHRLADPRVTGEFVAGFAS